MTAKELLTHYTNCVYREERLKAEILWEKKAIRSLDLIPVLKDRHYKAQVFVLKRNLQTFEERLVEVSKTKQRIHDLITEIPGIEGEVLTRRYVDGEIWDEICDGIHYSWQGVFRIHKRALQMVQDRLDQEAFFDT